jgi:hypothetical protein
MIYTSGSNLGYQGGFVFRDLFQALLNVQKDAACVVHQQIYYMILVCLRSEAQDLRHGLFITQECVKSPEEMIKAQIFVEYH